MGSYHDGQISREEWLEEAKQLKKLRLDSVLLIELQDVDASWPLPRLSTRKLVQNGTMDSDGNLNKEFNDGWIGIDNLGNTCYLSSPLQCLIHTPLLCDYFLKDYYKSDLNLSTDVGAKVHAASSMK